MDTKQIVKALRQMFWGGIIIILDVNFGGFDIVVDALGVLLIVLGVYSLARQEGGAIFQRKMRIVKPLVLVFMYVSFVELLPLPQVARHWLGIVFVPWLVAIYLFCTAMRAFCEHHTLSRSSKSWNMTSVLVLFIYVIPLSIAYIGVWVGGTFLQGQGEFSFNANAAEYPQILIFLIVGVAPLIHLFISTSRIKREVAKRST